MVVIVCTVEWNYSNAKSSAGRWNFLGLITGDRKTKKLILLKMSILQLQAYWMNGILCSCYQKTNTHWTRNQIAVIHCFNQSMTCCNCTSCYGCFMCAKHHLLQRQYCITSIISRYLIFSCAVSFYETRCILRFKVNSRMFFLLKK